MGWTPVQYLWKSRVPLIVASRLAMRSHFKSLICFAFKYRCNSLSYKIFTVIRHFF